MSFITTATGHELHLTQPSPGSITLPCIAHSLAQINRFTGHCRRPYSVAEHSVLVVQIMERDFRVTCPHALFAGLLHDAHEAYCGDLHTPGKRVVGPAWDAFEGRLAHAVRSAFAIHAASTVWAESIKQADMVALATEKRDLLPPTATPWVSLTGVQPADWLRLDDGHRDRMTWCDWRQIWLDKANELDFARNEAMGLSVGTEAAAT
jgi:hypothetical protein